MSRVSAGMDWGGWAIGRDGREWTATRVIRGETVVLRAPTGQGVVEQIEQFCPPPLEAAMTIRSLRQQVKTLCETIEEAHDTHIYSDDDEHDEDCGYCSAVAEARRIAGLGPAEEVR